MGLEAFLVMLAPRKASDPVLFVLFFSQLLPQESNRDSFPKTFDLVIQRHFALAVFDLRAR